MKNLTCSHPQLTALRGVFSMTPHSTLADYPAPRTATLHHTCNLAPYLAFYRLAASHLSLYPRHVSRR